MAEAVTCERGCQDQPLVGISNVIIQNFRILRPSTVHHEDEARDEE